MTKKGDRRFSKYGTDFKVLEYWYSRFVDSLLNEDTIQYNTMQYCMLIHVR